MAEVLQPLVARYCERWGIEELQFAFRDGELNFITGANVTQRVTAISNLLRFVFPEHPERFLVHIDGREFHDRSCGSRPFC